MDLSDSNEDQQEFQRVSMSRNTYIGDAWLGGHAVSGNDQVSKNRVDTLKAVFVWCDSPQSGIGLPVRTGRENKSAPSI